MPGPIMRNTPWTRPEGGLRQRIEELHALWVKLSKLDLQLTESRARVWATWLPSAEPHADKKLRGVVLYLDREIRAGRRQPGALKLANLLHPDRWDEDLAFARKAAGARRPASPAPPREFKTQSPEGSVSIRLTAEETQAAATDAAPVRQHLREALAGLKQTVRAAGASKSPASASAPADGPTAVPSRQNAA